MCARYLLRMLCCLLCSVQLGKQRLLRLLQQLLLQWLLLQRLQLVVLLWRLLRGCRLLLRLLQLALCDVFSPPPLRRRRTHNH